MVDFISENPNITTQEMANLLGINRSIIARHIKTLQEKGIIRRVGPDKGGHCEIIEK
ncbi:MAG: MarR family transcriptional regulator [Paludibacteraceae bacterium]|nr:MarR family transcriptional regulator [Paludibacteraceae bacterium]